MCLFNESVEEVHNTSLFACLNNARNRQLLIYSNSVENSNKYNAMVLPVPNPHTITLHDMTSASKFFPDLEKCFKPPASYARSLGAKHFDANSKLVVHDVGSYLISIVPSINDFSRLRTETFDFNLSENLKTFLAHYDHNFGYLVCRLKMGNVGYSPIAYSHNVLTPNELFYPTTHYHSDKAVVFYDGMEGDWDHNIYAPNMEFVNMPVDSIDKAYVNPYFGNIKIGFDFPNQYNAINRVVVTGNHPNRDVIIRCK